MIVDLTERLRVRLDRDMWALEELTDIAATNATAKRAAVAAHTKWSHVGWYGHAENAFDRAVKLTLDHRQRAAIVGVAEFCRILRATVTEIGEKLSASRRT